MKSILKLLSNNDVECLLSNKRFIILPKKPNIKTPFKMYLYQTDDNGFNTLNTEMLTEKFNRKVIGEVICDEIIRFKNKENNLEYLNHPTKDTEFDFNLNLNTIKDYKKGYIIHFKDVKLYINPKDLCEFNPPLETVKCKNSYKKYCNQNCTWFGNKDACDVYKCWKENCFTEVTEDINFVEEVE